MPTTDEIIDIQSIYSSNILQKILLSLNDGKKDNSELCQITGSSSSTISQDIRRLKNSKFVKKEDYSFCITPAGKMLASNLKNTNMAFEVIHKFKDFWSSHFIKGIPEPLLNNIGDLYISEIIRDTGSYNKAFTNYIHHLKKAKQMFAVSDLTNVALCDAMIELLKQGVPIEFVHTDNFSKILISKEYSEKRDELIKCPNFQSMVCKDDIKIGLTVTDNFLSFGLYKKNGTGYDCSEDLFSSDKKAIEWGIRLFQ